MYICLCQAVNERHIRESVQQGVRSMRELRQQLGVAASCGRCARHALHVLRQEGAAGEGAELQQVAG